MNKEPGQQSNPEQKPEQAPKINSKMLKNVTVTIIEKDKEAVTFDCLRNLIEVKKALNANKAFTDALPVETTKVKITFNFENSEEHPVLVEGTAKEIMVFLDSNILSTKIAMRMLQHLCVRLIETSPLKCGIVTFLFEDNQVGGIGLLNEATEVDSGSINAFVSAAGGQLDMYKEQMRKLGITLIGDSNIIIPGK